MGNRRRRLGFAVLAVFFAGAASGVLFQRYVGLGNTLRAGGIWEQRATAEVLPTPTRPPRGLPAEFHGRVALFILAGQSNMEGAGEIPEEQVLHEHAFVFGNDYVWRLASEPIDHPEEQVDPVSGASGRLGPGLAFAMSLLEEEPNVVVGLIPCARGNTSIQEWERSLSDETLYGACLKRIGAASTVGEPAGILVFQGEADALEPTQNPDRLLSAANYGAVFARFIGDLRADLGRPDLPVVFAQIGTTDATEAFSNWSLIREQQAAVDLHCIRMITTADLPLADGLHFTTESYQIIGARFAAAYLELLASSDC
jgi:lysophospholipase L1-like esterase